VAELPVGTVTFLFTDIEGSTQLLKQLRDGYGDVLAEHHRLLREAFEAAGGQEIDTEGDAFFFAFRRARDAVAAAVAGQRALVWNTSGRKASPSASGWAYTPASRQPLVSAAIPMRSTSG
jgi:class 3 adenylate cyclase